MWTLEGSGQRCNYPVYNWSVRIQPNSQPQFTWKFFLKSILNWCWDR